MPRLILRDYHKDTTESNVRDLFSKIGEVGEIYIPKPTVTGIIRNFAIVSLNCSNENVQKNIKALNGSSWNGGRINIEMAKEYYKDRVQRELLDMSLNTIEKQNIEKPVEYAQWKESYVNLRVKPNSPCIRISTIPGEYGKGMIPCGWKGFSAKPVKNIVSDDVPNDKSPNPVVQIKAGSSSSSNLREVSGGGLRKGFGNIVIPAVSQTKVKEVDCCIEKDVNSTNRNSEFDDFDQSISRYFEEEYSEPCITSADLEESVLQKERERALNVLNEILGGSSKDSSIEPTGEKVANLNSDQIALKSSNSTINNGWNTAVIRRFDPAKTLKLSSEQELDAKQHDSNFAEMNVLKDIFYKDGGVGWNESKKDIAERLSTSTNVKNDSLFLEAEKFGFDIRNNNDSSDGVISNSLFNFFEDSDQLPVYSNSEDKSVENLNDVAAERSEDTFSSLYSKRKLLPPLSIDEVREMAAKFCRVSSVDLLKSQWEESREKLLLDYKKKARESKKQGIAKVTTVQLPITSSSTKSAIRRKSTRGGVKHRRLKSN